MYSGVKAHSFKFIKNENRDTKLEVKIMENYRKSAHCTYDIKYHLVWITKYHKPVITGQIALRTRALIRMICQSNEVDQDLQEKSNSDDFEIG